MNTYLVYVVRKNGGREIYEVVTDSHEAARQWALEAHPEHQRCFAVTKAYKG